MSTAATGSAGSAESSMCLQAHRAGARAGHESNVYLIVHTCDALRKRAGDLSVDRYLCAHAGRPLGATVAHSSPGGPATVTIRTGGAA